MRGTRDFSFFSKICRKYRRSNNEGPTVRYYTEDNNKTHEFKGNKLTIAAMTKWLETSVTDLSTAVSSKTKIVQWYGVRRDSNGLDFKKSPICASYCNLWVSYY